MKSINILGILMLGLLFQSCEEENLLIENEIQNTSWESNYEVIHKLIIAVPEGSPGFDTIQYTSIIHFYEDQFTVNVAPPVRPSEYIWWTGSRSQWFGDYNIEDDTIFFNVADSSVSNSPYLYEMSIDSLFLSMVYSSTDEGIMLVPLGGGLPWGHAGMIHHGWFKKVAE